MPFIHITTTPDYACGLQQGGMVYCGDSTTPGFGGERMIRLGVQTPWWAVVGVRASDFALLVPGQTRIVYFATNYLTVSSKDGDDATCGTVNGTKPCMTLTRALAVSGQSPNTVITLDPGRYAAVHLMVMASPVTICARLIGYVGDAVPD